ncbi:hypothetical protein [Micromonospora sp. 4G55]|uniref:hypothetical protein n=1 Tax=Micromonospora sp. 4G55 TaxID=2806102 RepID=UPI001A5E1561|nr:hypothetical protein [Micromonospora sp. 4G55]MBM0256363.1 hypothetical protein [Micromonospora sp. 4G55]
MITQVFTFGYGQTCPYTGESLADRYAVIDAPTKELCRRLMLAVFGREWAFQYASVGEATGHGRYPMAEHMRLTYSGPPDPLFLTAACPECGMPAKRHTRKHGADHGTFHCAEKHSWPDGGR